MDLREKCVGSFFFQCGGWGLGMKASVILHLIERGAPYFIERGMGAKEPETSSWRLVTTTQQAESISGTTYNNQKPLVAATCNNWAIHKYLGSKLEKKF